MIRVKHSYTFRYFLPVLLSGCVFTKGDCDSNPNKPYSLIDEKNGALVPYKDINKFSGKKETNLFTKGECDYSPNKPYRLVDGRNDALVPFKDINRSSGGKDANCLSPAHEPISKYDKMLQKKYGSTTKKTLKHQNGMETSDIFLFHSGAEPSKNLESINTSLNELGYKTWFDIYSLNSNSASIIRDELEAVRNATYILLWISEELEKLSTKDSYRSSLLKFVMTNYPEKIIPVVGDAKGLQRLQGSLLSYYLDNHIYLDFSRLDFEEKNDLELATFRLAGVLEQRTKVQEANRKIQKHKSEGTSDNDEAYDVTPRFPPTNMSLTTVSPGDTINLVYSVPASLRVEECSQKDSGNIKENISLDKYLATPEAHRDASSHAQKFLKYDAFFSHVHGNENQTHNIVLKIADDLNSMQEKPFSFFIDSRSLDEGGVEYHTVFPRAIMESRTFVIFVNKEYLSKLNNGLEWVTRELNIAERVCKKEVNVLKIIVVTLDEDVTPDGLPHTHRFVSAGLTETDWIMATPKVLNEVPKKTKELKKLARGINKITPSRDI